MKIRYGGEEGKGFDGEFDALAICGVIHMEIASGGCRLRIAMSRDDAAKICRRLGSVLKAGQPEAPAPEPTP